MGKYIALNDQIYEYLLAQRSHATDPILDLIRTETQARGWRTTMAVSLEECSFLSLLTGLLGTRVAVEIGTFTGSSSLSIARSLAQGGKLYCFDQNEEWTNLARTYWQKAGVESSIHLTLGNARELIAQFHPDAPIDLVFVDADREGYDFYFETLLPKVRTGGLLIFDNALRHGDVADPKNYGDSNIRALHEMNRKLATDSRVQSVLLPVADGIHLARKL